MTTMTFNKFRAAVEVLQRGREQVVEAIADDVLDQGDDLLETSYQFNEFLETQGTRLHFLLLLIQQLEQSAENVEEAQAPPPLPQPKPRKARKPRASKKLSAKASAESTTEEG